MKKSKKSQSSHKIVRTPVKKTKEQKRIDMLRRWKNMYLVEKQRTGMPNLAKQYSRYKNDFFISLIKDATRIEFWSKFDLSRMKMIRKTIEIKYYIPINYYSAFVYYSTFNYLNWKKRDFNYRNYLGFISSESNMNNFANFILSKSVGWRIKKSVFPEDYHEKWGLKVSAKTIKLGPKDKKVKYNLLSDDMVEVFIKHGVLK